MEMRLSMSSFGALQEAYELPNFDSILSEDFRARYGLAQARQYGIACQNVKAECATSEALGAGPFLPANIPAPNWVENGQPINPCKLEFALGYAEDHQVEFLGPCNGTSFYSDALQGRENTLHHIGIYQNGSDEIEERLNKDGIKTAVTGGVVIGKLLGFEFKYFDTRDELGCYLELLDFRMLNGIQISVETPVKELARLHSFLFGSLARQ
jgi:hypothetical protein